jgi:hypothetical protein
MVGIKKTVRRKHLTLVLRIKEAEKVVELGVCDREQAVQVGALVIGMHEVEQIRIIMVE